MNVRSWPDPFDTGTFIPADRVSGNV